MSNSLEACRIFTKVVLDGRPWDLDPLCLRMPWDQAAYELRDHGKGKGMCFAIMWDNEIVKPHPPVMRAMTMVKTALERAGHKGDSSFPTFHIDITQPLNLSLVIDWKPYRHMDIFHNVVRPGVYKSY
jgi:amidase